ncbi:OmpA family protein [Marivibrio halodurans]|uniref:OmpA family protein n=1 Tax=Marivibrio halodurans TaxID=2039722 RepID=A0A8J7V432_9PROT|nr:OmpA family protein [Marivibrio halodurans]MBP5858926.1 OmpA family protein [Marivibrio halodurans]
MFRFAVIACAVALLGACTTWDLEELQKTEPTGSEFTRALAKEYQTFAEFEAYEMKDWIDQEYFAEKGLRAARGEVVPPEELSDWNLPEDRVNEMAEARSRLIAALNTGGRRNHPMEAAHAQAKFDCWVEQQEENHQPEDIEACQEEFEAALAKLQEVMEPEPEPEPEPKPEPEPQVMEPVTFMVFFDFDSTALNDGAMAILELVEERLPAYNDGFVDIVGHADTSGSTQYNMDLSMRRATTVRDALAGRGISNGSMAIDAKGESDPMVATGDGVRSPQNRRVTITIE